MHTTAAAPTVTLHVVLLACYRSSDRRCMKTQGTGTNAIRSSTLPITWVARSGVFLDGRGPFRVIEGRRTSIPMLVESYGDCHSGGSRRSRQRRDVRQKRVPETGQPGIARSLPGRRPLAVPNVYLHVATLGSGRFGSWVGGEFLERAAPRSRAQAQNDGRCHCKNAHEGYCGCCAGCR